MGWDNAGGYNRQHNFSADASSGIKILAARMDAELDDFASAMTLALTRNGQNVPTVNLPMGGFRHINVGAPTSVNNYMRSREFIENVPIFMTDTESSADRISVSAQYFTSVSANQAPGDGTRILVRAGSNKSSAVVYLNGHSANVEFQDGSRANTAMVSGGIYELLFSSVDVAWKITAPDDGRTAAEAAAGVTPTNYQYEPGNVLRYGAAGDDATDSTTAFDNAIASNEKVYVPAGTYRLTALSTIDDRCIIYGDGATSILKFNTTGVGLSFDISPGLGNPQSESFTVRDLGFTNVTNTPAAFIQNGATSNGTVNGLIERCYFSSCAATYCIDAFIGYGLKIRNCVFATVTGSAIRLQDSLNQASGYSFVASIDGCDITGPSVHGIVIDGAQVLGISNTIIESCGGKGIYVLALTNTVQAWNIHLDNVYLEANTGTDIDLADVDGTYVAQMLLTSCQLTGSPTIALGTHSQVTIQNCWNSGGSSCTVSGSSLAGAILINSINFTKSGTFRWVELGILNSTQNTTDAIAFTPSWGADAVNPAIGDGTIVGYYTRLGKNVHVEVEINMGSTTTFGTGDWFFGDMPFTCDANIGSMGAGELFDNNTGNNYPAAARIAKNTAIVRVVGVGTTANGVDSAQPFTWAQSDILRFSIDYIAA